MHVESLSCVYHFCCLLTFWTDCIHFPMVFFSRCFISVRSGASWGSRVLLRGGGILVVYFYVASVGRMLDHSLRSSDSDTGPERATKDPTRRSFTRIRGSFTPVWRLWVGYLITYSGPLILTQDQDKQSRTLRGGASWGSWVLLWEAGGLIFHSCSGSVGKMLDHWLWFSDSDRGPEQATKNPTCLASVLLVRGVGGLITLSGPLILTEDLTEQSRTLLACLLPLAFAP